MLIIAFHFVFKNKPSLKKEGTFKHPNRDIFNRPEGFLRETQVIYKLGEPSEEEASTSGSTF